jgi:hypothetical protein
MGSPVVIVGYTQSLIFLLHLKKNQKTQLFIDRHLTFRRDGQSAVGVAERLGPS